MAALYALLQFCFHNAVTDEDETVLMGARKDSASQAVLQTPASFWSAVPLAGAANAAVADSTIATYPAVYGTTYPAVVEPPIHPKLAAWLAVYPTGGVS